nr:hypothetical protein [Bacteroidota bacterium]
MSINNKYTTRPIRFLEVYECGNWKIKIYSISIHNEFVKKETIDIAKTNISEWLKNASNYPLETYKIATLILHEGKEGCFAIINWWIDDNMLQQLVYLSNNMDQIEFKLYSDKGIITCVWELEIIWFERNAWVKHVLSNPANADFTSYLNEHLNKD